MRPAGLCARSRRRKSLFSRHLLSRVARRYTVPYKHTVHGMRFQVVRLRYLGRPLPKREWCNRPPIVGDLRVEQLYDEELLRHVRIARLMSLVRVIGPEQFPYALRSGADRNESAGVHARRFRARRGRGLCTVVVGDHDQLTQVEQPRNNEPRRSGAVVEAESVTACDARSRDRQDQGRGERAWRVWGCFPGRDSCVAATSLSS